MKNELAITMQLLNIEAHEAVETNAQGKKYIPISVVRCMAHEMLAVLRDKEAIENEMLGHLTRAREILKGLNEAGVKNESTGE